MGRMDNLMVDEAEMVCISCVIVCVSMFSLLARPQWTDAFETGCRTEVGYFGYAEGYSVVSI